MGHGQCDRARPWGQYRAGAGDTTTSGRVAHVGEQEKCLSAPGCKEGLMNYMDDKEAIELLRKAGCTALELERLRRLRREYAEKGRDRASQDHRRPGFAGWLETFLQEELRYFSFWGW